NGSGKPQPHALAVLDDEVREKLAEGAIAREYLTRELEEMIHRVNATLDPYERLQFVAVVKDTWAVENGFLTPTMKVKRAAIEAAYGGVTDSWYARNEPVVWQA